MSNIAKIVGERIRTYRNKLGYSQEELAEKSNLHNTYIGQLERGEKNATLESIEKVCLALNIPLEILLKNITITQKNIKNEIPNIIYDLVNSLKISEQKSIYKIIREILLLKNL